MSSDRVSAPVGGPAWLAEAGRLLQNLGFILVDSEPETPGTARLLVALRERPTLHHFDPEEVAYWRTEGGRGHLTSLDLATGPLPGQPYAWGRITLTDRLAVRNQFVTFGGTVRAAGLDPATLAVEFSSPAPILRWSGHSQGLDPLTAEVGAFFGRVMIPIDFVPTAEALVAGADPLALYAAFVHDTRERFAHSEPLREAQIGLATWSGHESARLGAAAPGAWRAGLELWAGLGLGAT